MEIADYEQALDTLAEIINLYGEEPYLDMFAIVQAELDLMKKRESTLDKVKSRLNSSPKKHEIGLQIGLPIGIQP